MQIAGKVTTERVTMLRSILLTEHEPQILMKFCTSYRNLIQFSSKKVHFLYQQFSKISHVFTTGIAT